MVPVASAASVPVPAWCVDRQMNTEIHSGGRTDDGSATGRHGRADRSERRAPSFIRSGARARGGGPPVADNAVVGARIYPEPGSVVADVDALGDFTQIPVVRRIPSPRSCCERSAPSCFSFLPSRLPPLASPISPPQRERPAGKGRPLGDFGESRECCVPRRRGRERPIRRARGR